MICVEIDSIDATYHFAAESFLMQHSSLIEPLWMFWRTDKCAMLGGYQIASAEIDLTYAKKLGIEVVRRSSGGGTIFTDLNTLQYSVILPYDDNSDPKIMERKYVSEPIVKALNRLGVPAEVKGRNDIVVEGRKVSGLAQHIRKGHLCTHGSLLYSTDLDILTKVLRVDETKLQTKAIRSMRSRVATISEYLDDRYSILEFQTALSSIIFERYSNQTYTMSDAELREIEKIRREKYANPDWIISTTPQFSIRNQKRFALGKVEVCLDVTKGIIRHCRINGDFLGLLDIKELEAIIVGTPHTTQHINAVLSNIDLSLYLGGIKREEFLSCVFEYGIEE